MGHEDTEPFAHVEARRLRGSLEGLPGRGHGLSAGVQDQPTLRDQLRMLSVDLAEPDVTQHRLDDGRIRPHQLVGSSFSSVPG